MSDLVYNTGIVVVLILSGLAVGWRVHAGGLEFLAGVGILLVVTFAMSWVGVWIGLNVPTSRSRTRSASCSSSPPSTRSS